MPGSIGEEDDITRGIKRRKLYADMAAKNAETEQSPATGKMGTKKVSPEKASKALSHISLKRFNIQKP